MSSTSSSKVILAENSSADRKMERASDALSIDQIASRWIVSSDPEDTLSKIRPYVDAGFNHLVFHAPGKEQRRLLAAFTEQVLPGLRGCG